MSKAEAQAWRAMHHQHWITTKDLSDAAIVEQRPSEKIASVYRADRTVEAMTRTFFQISRESFRPMSRHPHDNSFFESPHRRIRILDRA